MQSYEDYLKYVLGENDFKIENLYKIEKNEKEKIDDRSIEQTLISSESDDIFEKENRMDEDIKIHTPSIKNNIEINDRNHIEKFYPEIYKRINPIINDVVGKNRSHVTENVIEKLTNEAYYIIERNGIINSYFRNEIRKENKHNQNRFFRDLIKILIIKRLLR